MACLSNSTPSGVATGSCGVHYTSVLVAAQLILVRRASALQLLADLHHFCNAQFQKLTTTVLSVSAQSSKLPAASCRGTHFASSVVAPPGRFEPAAGVIPALVAAITQPA